MEAAAKTQAELLTQQQLAQEQLAAAGGAPLVLAEPAPALAGWLGGAVSVLGAVVCAGLAEAVVCCMLWFVLGW